MAIPDPRTPLLKSPKRRQRALRASHWRAGLLGASALVLVASSISTLGAAAAGPVDLQAHFQLDGNIADSGGTAPCDWATVNIAGSGTDGTACTDATMFDHTGVIQDLYVNGKDPSAFTTGSSDVNDIGTWGCTDKPFTPKNNILNTYAATFLIPASDGTHRVVYMGQERESNNGNAFAGFWLLHTAAGCTPPASGNASWTGSHTNGDLLIVSNYTNGGGANAIDIYAWVNGALNQTPIFISINPCTTPTAIVVACAIANGSPLAQPSWGPQALDSNEFVEAGVDLTAVDQLLANSTPPLTGLSSCFTNFMSETRSSQSATAELHDYALGQTNTCPTPSLPTDDTVNGYATSGTVGQAMTIGDSVTPTGGANPTGHVDFTLYADSKCTVPASPAVASGDVALTNGSASYSKSWTPSSTGTYYWFVSYSGDANNGANTACGGTKETLTVGKASPTITTQAVPTTGTVGVNIAVVGDTATFHDTASVAAPTGSVTFTLYNSNCSTSTGVTGSGSITTNGSGVSSATFTTSWTPPSAGTYQWKASYAGDGNNNGFTTGCGDAHEQLVIGAVSPTITTQASPVSGTSGVAITNLSDTATFHGNTVAPTGSVSFTLYSDAACQNAVSGVSGSGSISTDGGGVSTATYTKASWTPLAAGTYYWIASYAGDNNNNPFTTTCGDANEEVVIGKASPTITTQASPTTGTSGVTLANVGDTATFHGMTSTPPTGSVTFTLYSDASCQTAVAGVSGSGSISAGSATYTAHDVTLAAGTYYWKASYAGDSNNNGFTTGCGDANEELVIGKASPTITTDASPTSGSIGVPMTVGDTATFHSTTTIPPTGSVTFTLYANNSDGCNNPVAGVSGSGPIGTVNSVSTADFSTTWTPTATGTYYWIASYAGDSNNNGFTTGCGDPNEEVTILAPSLTLTKVADHTKSVPAGTPIGFTITLKSNGPGTAAGVLLSDTLPAVPTTSGAQWVEAAAPTLTGSDLSGVTCALSTATPQVFSCGTGAGFLMAPGDQISVHLTHATDATTAASGTPAGTYPNTVTASATNATVPSASATEYVEALSTTPSATSAVQTPATVTDTATVTGGHSPTGTITWNVYGPGDTTCSTSLATFTAPLDSTGHATSGAFVATKAGTYQWVASYSGDASNSPLSGSCGDATEQFSTFTVAVLPAKTGDWSIFMVLGAPFILLGILLLALSRRRREGEA